MKLARLTSLLILATAPSFAGAVYSISVDTSSLAPGTSGFIDLAFNGGFPATATIDSFSLTGGSLAPATLFTQGNVTGTLPGEVSMDQNNTDYDEGLSFGTAINFVLTLSGTPGGTVGDVFTLSFFNSTLDGALLTGNVNDLWLAQFQMDTSGNVTPTAFANPSGGPSFATITTPEPATGILLLVALLGALVAKSRLRQLV